MNFRNSFVIAAIIATALGVGLLAYVFLRKGSVPEPVAEPVALESGPEHFVLGSSVEGRSLDVYEYGNGKTNLLFAGGMHGGYEWNSVLLAYEFMDYLDANPEIIPANLTIVVIPSLNPDGVYKVVGYEGRFTVSDAPEGEAAVPGRLNAHAVDLNRNFDCKWKPEAVWREKVVSAGTAPFSEPESAALRKYVLENAPAAVIFWHSKANAVYASECKEGILPQTLDIMNAYARASGYQAVRSFDAYEVTGDSEGWLASIGIPAITVELKTHENIEWDRNLAGIKALFEYYGR
ncbi:MAG: M14 family metallopeptidase [Patescibacteria group bacterium]